jgi:ElaA protein
MEDNSYKSVVKRFEDLAPKELYDLLALRQEVFVVEQNCVYQDLDGKDQSAIHFLITEPATNEIIAYARAFAPGTVNDSKAVIGRVVVREKYRKMGLGKRVMVESIDYCHQNFPGYAVKISAQTYLKSFYTSLGFIDTGVHYLEDGIPHMAMVLTRL